MATSPMSMPLHSMLGSGFRPLAQSVSIVAMAAVTPGEHRVDDDVPIRRSVPDSVEPG
jgi:hypothetical protein